MRKYTREDVETHGGLPAVNVKVYRSIRDAWPEYERTERPDDAEDFTLDWIEENVSEEALDAIFWHTCEAEYEYLEGWTTGSDGGEDALFPDDSVRLDIAGRSGGWIEVRGLPDIEEWDAVRLARWRRFARIARSIADGIPFQMLCSIETNEYEWRKTEDAERERAANEDIATV